MAHDFIYLIYGCILVTLLVVVLMGMFGGKDDKFIAHLQKSELLWIHNAQESERRLLEARVEAAVLKQLLPKPKPARSRPPKVLSRLISMRGMYDRPIR